MSAISKKVSERKNDLIQNKELLENQCFEADVYAWLMQQPPEILRHINNLLRSVMAIQMATVEEMNASIANY